MLSSIRPFSYSFSPEKIPETSQGLEIRAVSPALSYPPFIRSSLRNLYSFPVFFQKLPPPLPRPNILFLSSHSKPIRRSVPVPAPAPAQNRCRPPRLFLFPFPASAGSQADGKWPFFASQVPVCSLFTPALRRMPPLSSPFCAQNAPASPTAPCSLPKLPIPFSPLGNRFILLPNRSFFFFLRQNYEKLSGFN